MMKQQRQPNQAIEHLKDMRNMMIQDEELGMQRHSVKIMRWTLYVAIATLIISLATLVFTIMSK